MTKQSNVVVFIICLFALIMMQFVGIFHISHIILFAILAPFVLFEMPKRLKFKKILIIMAVGIFLSMISCLHFRGQSMYETFKASAYIFLIFFYFFLTNRNYSVKNVENAIVVLGFIASILYILQYVLMQNGIIILQTADNIKEGDRFRVIGSGIISLSFFLSLNKIMTIKANPIYVACIVLGLVSIVLMGFRTMAVAIVIFSLFLSYRIWGLTKRMWIFIILFFVFAILLSKIPAVQDKLIYMLEKQQSGQADFSSDRYIRWIQLYYFLNFHFKGYVEMFFGSGMPYPTSRYGLYNADLFDSGIYYMDWGLLGLSWMIGIIPVVCMCCYSIIAYRMKVEKYYKYIGIWFIYLLTISITTMEFFREGNFVVQALALYLVVKVNKKYQLKQESRTEYENRNTDIL